MLTLVNLPKGTLTWALVESLSAWGKVFQTRGKSESADFPPGCQTFLRAHGTFLRCQIRVQLGLETEIGFQQILRMIPHHLTENSKTEEKFLTSDLSFSQVTEVDKREPRESFSKPRPHFWGRGRRPRPRNEQAEAEKCSPRFPFVYWGN